MLTPEQQAKKEEFKACFPKPDFVKADSLQILKIDEDQKGRIWAFVQYPRQFVHSPDHVRLSISGSAIDMAIRARWTDEHPEALAGERPFIEQFEVEKNPLLEPLLKGLQARGWVWIGAVELPFKPTAITIVDE